jgi:hypothetical protein
MLLHALVLAAILIVFVVAAYALMRIESRTGARIARLEETCTHFLSAIGDLHQSSQMQSNRMRNLEQRVGMSYRQLP